MALFFTLAIECYQEVDAARIGERLRGLVLSIGSHRIPMAVVYVEAGGDLWYIFANPQGPGFSQYGYGEGLNDSKVIHEIIDQYYRELSHEPGIRRALCGYEAQDFFEVTEGYLDQFDCYNFIYDRTAGPRQEGALEFGSYFYRNPPRPL